MPYFLYPLALFQQRGFVFDLVSRGPGLYLISGSLQFLDLFFEVIFQFVLLRGILGGVDLLVDALECLDAFVDLLEGFVDLLLRLS